tara:strand:+ start:1357 stop:2955 length:1599 start_codon:yes stop_codon:yes gene_type:complete
MAIQRIQRFGTYTPSPIDQSRARKMEQLAGLARSATNYVRTLSEEEAIKKAPEEAIADVKKAKETDGEVKLRGRFERGAEIYNATLEQAYVNSKEISFNEADAKLSVEFTNDLTGYTNAINAHKEIVLSNLNPNFKTQVETNLNAIQAETSAKIYKNQLETQQKEADEISLSFIDGEQNKAKTAASIGDLKNIEIHKSQVITELNNRVKNNQETQASIDAKLRNFNVELVSETAVYNLKQKLQKPNGVSLVTQDIQEIENTSFKDFSIDEKNNLVATLTTELKEFISRENILDLEATTIKDEQREVIKNNLLKNILNGTGTVNDIVQADILADDKIRLESLQSRKNKGTNDYQTIALIQSLYKRNPDEALAILFNEVGDNVTVDTAISTQRVINDFQDKESILSQGPAARFSEYLENAFVPKNYAGKLDLDKLKQQQDLLLVYEERVLAGEDPKEVFRSLYQLIPLIQTGFSTEQEAINALDQRAQNDEKQGYPMDEAVYNALYDEIKETFKQQENFKEYQNYLKFFQTGQQ